MLFLASCEMKNELTGSLTDKVVTGALELGVSVKQPVSHTRADVSGIDTNTFPIEIKGTSEGVDTVVRRYNTLAEMPASISVPVGTYSVSSHTPGELQKKMTSPYYAGDTKATVSKDITSTVDVVCRMANSRIQMNYGDDFKDAFSEWTITIDDGSEMALSYTQDNQSPEAVYWSFGDNVDAIKVNITAKTTEGNTVSQRQTFRKADASENYDDVSDNFMGGDALQIEMGAVESATGTVTGVTINAHITFEDESEAVEIPTTGEDTEEGGSEQPTPNPGEGVTLDLPDDVTYSISTGTAPSKADAYIASEAGLDKIVVTITAGNDAFQAILVDLTMDGQSFLAENGGVDLIDNADFGNLVATVGSQAPTDGTKEYTFPIGAFFTFLDMPGATDAGKHHEFHITVTDKNGEEAQGVFKVTINE